MAVSLVLAATAPTWGRGGVRAGLVLPKNRQPTETPKLRETHAEHMATGGTTDDSDERPSGGHPGERGPSRFREPAEPDVSAPRSRSRSGAAPAQAPVTAPPAEPVPLLEALRRGGSLDDAVVSQMRHLLDAGEHAAVGSIATSLRRHDDTADLGALVAGVAAERRGYSRLAWSQLGSLPVALWARHAPGEFVRAGLHIDPDAALDAVRALVADPSDVIDAEGWLALLGPVFGHGDAELAHALFVALDTAVGDGRDVDPDLVVNRDWLRHWVSLTPNGTDGTGSGERPGPVRHRRLRPPRTRRGRPRTSATTCRPSPRWVTSCVTRSSASPDRRTSSTSPTSSRGGCATRGGPRTWRPTSSC